MQLWFYFLVLNFKQGNSKVLLRQIISHDIYITKQSSEKSERNLLGRPPNLLTTLGGLPNSLGGPLTGW